MTRLEAIQQDLRTVNSDMEDLRHEKQRVLHTRKRLEQRKTSNPTYAGAPFRDINVGNLADVIQKSLLDRIFRPLYLMTTTIKDATVLVATNDTFTTAMIILDKERVSGQGITKRCVSDPIREDVGVTIAVERAIVDLLLKLPKLHKDDKAILMERAMR